MRNGGPDQLVTASPAVAATAARLMTSIVPLPSSEAPPGTNLHADLAASDWRFLLPRLRFRSTLYLGAPPAAAFTVLSEMAGTTIIVTMDAARCARILADLSVCGVGNVHVISADTARELPVRTGSVELLVAAAGAETSRLLTSAYWRAEADRLLSTDGVIYLETARLLDTIRLRQQIADLEQHGFTTPAMFVPIRRKGALRLMLPVGQDTTARYCMDRLISGTSQRARQLRQIARALVRVGLLELALPRRVVLLERGTGRVTRVAPYVHTGARAAGLPVMAGQAAFFSRSDYNANKIMLLAADATGAPRMVVKVTRSPVYNHRLQREHSALSLLHEGRFVEAGSYPEPLFLHYHYGLALIGQTVLTGPAFRNMTSARADCRYVTGAIEWLTRLGEASAERFAPANVVARDLEQMVTRFSELYPVTDRECGFLHDRVAALRNSALKLPLVFQHGDATTWNIVTREHGGVALLDWEHGAPHGMPLWDLFDFLESLDRWARRLRRGSRDGTGYELTFLASNALNQLVRRAVHAYCSRVAVPRELIEPLFYTCWVQRALRSVSSGGTPHETSPFFQLLRSCIAGRDREGLRCVFS